MSAAYYLSKAGVPATLFEKNQHLGGVITTSQVEGCLIEGGPDSFLAAKPAALELIKELGLQDEVIGSNDHLRVTYIVRNGRLVPMPDGLMMMVPTKIWPIALSPLIGWGTKIRMGLEIFRKPSPQPERSVAAMIRDHYGQEAVDYLAEPMLSGVYGGDPELLSADAVLEQFVALETKYGSLTKGVLARRAAALAAPSASAPGTSLFRTLKGGLAQLVEAIEMSIAGMVEVRREEVTSIRQDGGGFLLRTSSGGEYPAGGVIVCTPAWQAAELLKELNPTASEGLSTIAYNSSVTVGMIYDRAALPQLPGGFGFLVPAKERRTMAACTFVGTKFQHRVPEGKVLLRCFAGGTGINMPDEELIANLRAELRNWLMIEVKPSAVTISRWPRAMAQYTIGHKARVGAIMNAVKNNPGLELAGNAYEGIGIPDCIRMGKAAAARIAQSY